MLNANVLVLMFDLRSASQTVNNTKSLASIIGMQCVQKSTQLIEAFGTHYWTTLSSPHLPSTLYPIPSSMFSLILHRYPATSSLVLQLNSLLIRVLFKLNMKFEMRHGIFNELMFVLNCSVLVLVLTSHSACIFSCCFVTIFCLFFLV